MKITEWKNGIDMPWFGALKIETFFITIVEFNY